MMKMGVVNGKVTQSVSDIAESYCSGEQKCAAHGHQQYKDACQYHQHHCRQKERKRIVAHWIQVVCVVTFRHDPHLSMEQPAVNEVFEKAKKKHAKHYSQKNRERTEIMMAQTRKDQHN